MQLTDSTPCSKSVGRKELQKRSRFSETDCTQYYIETLLSTRTEQMLDLNSKNDASTNRKQLYPTRMSEYAIRLRESVELQKGDKNNNIKNKD